jgi:hypothetical protein
MFVIGSIVGGIALFTDISCLTWLAVGHLKYKRNKTAIDNCLLQATERLTEFIQTDSSLNTLFGSEKETLKDRLLGAKNYRAFKAVVEECLMKKQNENDSKNHMENNTPSAVVVVQKKASKTINPGIVRGTVLGSNSAARAAATHSTSSNQLTEDSLCVCQ